MIAYGCENIIYKLDKFGNCLEYTKNMIKENKLFKSFSDDQFLEFCVLSGCDFFKLPKIGSNKAYKIIRNNSLINSIDKIYKMYFRKY